MCGARRSALRRVVDPLSPDCTPWPPPPPASVPRLPWPSVWALAAPPSSTPLGLLLLPSFRATANFPLLSTGRQRLFVLLIGVGVLIERHRRDPRIQAPAQPFETHGRPGGRRRPDHAGGGRVQGVLHEPTSVGHQGPHVGPHHGHRRHDRGRGRGRCARLGGSPTRASLAPRLRRVGEWGVLVVAAITAGRFAISIFETPNSLKDLGNTSYLTNELLAPSAGSHPLLGYKATYSNLLGYVAWPFVHAGLNGPSVTTWLLTCCTALTLLGAFFLLRSIVRARWAFVGTVLVVGVTEAGRLPTEMPTRHGTLLFDFDAFSYHQIMPVRFLGVVVMANLAVLGLRRPTALVAALTGFAGTFVALNNPDYGAACLPRGRGHDGVLARRGIVGAHPVGELATAPPSRCHRCRRCGDGGDPRLSCARAAAARSVGVDGGCPVVRRRHHRVAARRPLRLPRRRDRDICRRVPGRLRFARLRRRGPPSSGRRGAPVHGARRSTWST